GERLHKRRLGDAGIALDQHVAAREQRDEQGLRDPGRADERAPDLVRDGASELTNTGELVGVERWLHRSEVPPKTTTQLAHVLVQRVEFAPREVTRAPRRGRLAAARE